MRNPHSQNLIIDINQSNLQDFIDCPRRFQLTSIQEKSWPAANSIPIEKAERSIFLGNRFHQAAHQFFIGLPEEKIQNSLNEPELLDMFMKFVQFASKYLSQNLFAEHLIQVPFKGYRLIAKFDLIVQLDDEFLIVDWKTSARKPPPSELAILTQTNLYPFIFNRAGNDLFSDQSINPDRIKFMYWFPLCSDHETIFTYSTDKNTEFEYKLAGILDKITELQENKDVFPLTSNLAHCEYCCFRSLCERGNIAGTNKDLEDLFDDNYQDLILDIEQITELEF